MLRIRWSPAGLAHGEPQQEARLGERFSIPSTIAQSVPMLVLVLTMITVQATSWAGDKVSGCVNPPCPVVTDFNNAHPFKACFTRTLVLPYKDDSYLYGYFDYCPGRGPLITLGDGTLQQGFRGYGMFGSPGYGRGMQPTSYIDLSRYRRMPVPQALHTLHHHPIAPREAAALPAPRYLPDPGPAVALPRRVTTGQQIAP
jgi:hypothetical protein